MHKDPSLHGLYSVCTQVLGFVCETTKTHKLGGLGIFIHTTHWEEQLYVGGTENSVLHNIWLVPLEGSVVSFLTDLTK